MSEHRAKGNQLYSSVVTDPLGAKKNYLWKVTQLEDSLKHFEEGKKDASMKKDSPEWLKCSRSEGVVSFRLASDPSIQSKQDFTKNLYYFKRSLSAFCAALSNANGFETKEWMKGIIDKIAEVIKEISNYLNHQFESWKERFSVFQSCQKLDNIAGSSSILVIMLIHFYISKEIQKAIIRADEEDDWRQCLSLTNELEGPMIRCSSYLTRCKTYFATIPLPKLDEEDLDTVLNELNSSRRLYYARSIALQYYCIADEMNIHALFEEENLNMDLIFLCLDNYGAAITSLRVLPEIIVNELEDNQENYHCYETAAKVSSAMATILLKVLKDDAKSHPIFLRVIQYADIVTHTNGATFFHRDWYQRAKDAIEAYRRKRAAYDASEIAKQREPMLKKLKPELDAILAAMNKFESKAYRAHALLVHLYDKHPPKNGKLLPEGGVDREDNDQIKKNLLKAAANYHPDLKVNKETGIEWQIFCEEIAKHINGLYEYFK